MLWWLYRESHITRRQLRVWFAVNEMAERRRYTSVGASRKPAYGIAELANLVGGRGSATALRELKADAKRLAAIGLVTISKHEVVFATSIEQLRLELDPEIGLKGFFAFLENPVLNNGRGTVPVPRRMLRALAAGFGRAETGYIMAALIRSVFWRAKERRYRVDGRMKLADVEKTFGISRRALTNARRNLIDLGWLQPLAIPQWQANKWGVHDVVDVDWKRPSPTAVGGGEDLPQQVESAGESASPHPQNAGESASPSKQVPSTRFITRTLGPRGEASSRPDPSGVSLEGDLGRRKKKTPHGGGGHPRTHAPNIRNVQSADLRDTDRLLELHRQALEARLCPNARLSELDFLALANRARNRGHKPGALFSWYLRQSKTEYITDSDEDAARARLRQHRRALPVDDVMARALPGLLSPRSKGNQEEGGIALGELMQPSEAPAEVEERMISEEHERFVQACVRVAQQRRIADPFRVAEAAKGWSRAQWDDAYLRYRTMQAQRWHGVR